MFLPNRIKRLSSCLVFTVVTLVPCTVFALSSDRYLPYRIKADTVIYNRNLHKTIYQGHVDAIQGTTHLDGDKVVVYTGQKNNKIILIVATGKNAHYSTLPDNKSRLFAEAETIKYYPLKNQVFLIKHAKVTQDQNLFTGSHIWYDMRKQVVVSTNPSGQGRTTVVIEPQNKKHSSKHAYTQHKQVAKKL